MNWTEACRPWAAYQRHLYSEQYDYHGLWFVGGRARSGTPRGWLRGWLRGAYWWRLTLCFDENTIIADERVRRFATPEEAITACDLAVADLVLRGGLVQP